MSKAESKETPEALPEEVQEELESSSEHVLETEKPSDKSTDEHTEKPTVVTSKRYRLQQWMRFHKKIVIPAGIVLLLVIIAAIPYTRYLLAGTFWKQQFTVQVMDKETGKPVSSAAITLGGVQAQTDAAGKAKLKAKVGTRNLTVEKKYYKSEKLSVLVPILKQKDVFTAHVTATGRQVPVTVRNKLTKKPLAGALVTAADTKAKTDDKGKTVLVLPAGNQSVEAVITADGYTPITTKITVTTDEKINVLDVLPAGSVYFLSNATGKIDVVKSALDGSNRQTVLAGTGKEDKANTVLLASRDWKYLALLSRRDGGELDKVFLIDTSTDKAVTVDEGDAAFTFVGWSDHRFIYRVARTKLNAWEPNRTALKSYDAETRKLTTIDQTGGEGIPTNFVYTDFGGVFILKNEIVYTKNWNSSFSVPAITTLQSKKAELRSVRPDGSGNRVVQAYGPRAGEGTITVNAKLYEPGGIWLKPSDDVTEEYEDGKVKAIANVSNNDFYSGDYTTYLLSPSGKATFWSEPRDGKNTLFTGNEDAKEGKQIASLSEYLAYGWFTEDYLLVSKLSSELYILPTAGGDAVKVSDYYKPARSFDGYGYGYGGL